MQIMLQRYMLLTNSVSNDIIDSVHVISILSLNEKMLIRWKKLTMHTYQQILLLTLWRWVTLVIMPIYSLSTNYSNYKGSIFHEFQYHEKYFRGITHVIYIYITISNPRSHNCVLPVTKGLTNKWRYFYTE